MNVLDGWNTEKVARRCVMCGAEAGKPCTIISTDDDATAGEERRWPHFYR